MSDETVHGIANDCCDDEEVWMPQHADTVVQIKMLQKIPSVVLREDQER